MTWDPKELRIGVLGEFSSATAWSTDDATAYESKLLAQRRAKDAERKGDERAARLAVGLCADCDQLRDPESRRYCATHRENNRNRRRGMRERLPNTRAGRTLHFSILTRAPDYMQIEGEPPKTIEVDGYVTTGVYENGALGEFFVRVGKGAAEFGPAIDRWAEAVSIGLQYGVPVDTIVGKSVATRDEICGAVTGVEGIKSCTSPHDLIARWLLIKYGKGG